MVENPHSGFVAQIEAATVALQQIHNPEALLIMAKASRVNTVEGTFSRMTERGVTQIMSQGDGFRQVFVKHKCPRDRSGQSADLQSMRQTRDHPQAEERPGSCASTA